jgi:hypothetical protein
MTQKSLSEAVAELRLALGVGDKPMSQIVFAVQELKRSVTMVQRYEKGENIAIKDLAKMVELSRNAGRTDLAGIFKAALLETLGPEVIALVRENAQDGSASKKASTESSDNRRERRTA